MSEERIRFLEEVAQCDPKCVDVLVELGWLYEEDRHDFDLAVATLKHAIDIKPDCADAFFWLAKVYYHDGARYEFARDAAERALACQAAHPGASSLLGSIYDDLNMPERGIPLLEAAVASEPSWVNLHAVLDEIKTRSSLLPEAIAHAREALRLARALHACSTPETYSYFESCVTGRWVSPEDLQRLEQRAARRIP